MGHWQQEQQQQQQRPGYLHIPRLSRVLAAINASRGEEGAGESTGLGGMEGGSLGGGDGGGGCGSGGRGGEEEEGPPEMDVGDGPLPSTSHLLTRLMGETPLRASPPLSLVAPGDSAQGASGQGADGLGGPQSERGRHGVQQPGEGPCYSSPARSLFGAKRYRCVLV
eukprot:scaffold129566_cov18-Tisochrysis_lutea.AAC.2